MKWSRIARKSDGCKEKRGRDAETKEGEKNKYGRGKEKAGRDEVLVARTIKEQMQKIERKKEVWIHKRDHKGQQSYSCKEGQKNFLSEMDGYLKPEHHHHNKEQNTAGKRVEI